MRLQLIRSWSARRRRLLFVVAASVFVVAAILAFPAVADDLDAHWPALIAVLVVGSVATQLLAAVEFSIAATATPDAAAPTFGRALRVTIAGSMANLLPVPGSLAVRTGALATSGARLGSAVRASAALGFVWVGTALAVAGLLAAASGRAVAGALVGTAGLVITVASAAVLVRPLARARRRAVSMSAVGIEGAMFLLGSTRLFLVFGALGFSMSFPDGAALAVSNVLATATGIFPGGLGLREVLAAGIGELVGVTAAVALVGTAVDTVGRLGTLAFMSIGLALVPPPTDQ